MLTVLPVILLEWIPRIELNPPYRSYGGVFRRQDANFRVFRRSSYINRVFKENNTVSIIRYNRLIKTENETVIYIFDFSNFPEVMSGETIGDPSVYSTGLSLGTASILDVKTDGVPIDQGVKIEVSGGVEGDTYDIRCEVVTSGGSVRAVKGQITIE